MTDSDTNDAQARAHSERLQAVIRSEIETADVRAILP